MSLLHSSYGDYWYSWPGKVIFFLKYFQVAFSSLNLLLHTQALLSSINYLTTIIPSDGQNMSDTKDIQVSTEKQQKNSALQKGMKNTVCFQLERVVELQSQMGTLRDHLVSHLHAISPPFILFFKLSRTWVPDMLDKCD